MLRQTLPFEWLVCNSGKPLTLVAGQKQIQTPSKRPIESFHNNLISGLSEATGEYIFFIEDDDWYAPNYLEQTLKEIGDYQLFGEGRAKYYHIPTRTYKTHINSNHASLCQTVIHKSVKDWLINYISTSHQIYVDLHMWRHAPVKRKVVVRDKSLCIGIKGLGSVGLGNGHRRLRERDEDLSVLKSWVGEDYKEFF